MAKRILTLLLALLLLAIFPTSVGAVEEKRDFVEGESYVLPLNEAVSLQGAKAQKSSLTIENGSAKYEFLLPIYSDSVKITSQTSGSIKMVINENEYDITLKDGENEFVFPTPERLGEKDLTISASGNIIIKDISFVEITEEKSFVPTVLDVPEYETALCHAFIIKENSPIIKMNAAKRYLDYNDIMVTPVYIDGSLYIPAQALADALSAYFEEDKSKDFMIFRKGNIELLYLNGEMKSATNGVWEQNSIKKEEINGKTYLPVRAVSELFGKYVLYKDGFVIVDYRSSTRLISEVYFDELVEEYKEYITSPLGKTYYVSKTANASDENDGSIDRPFATVSKAAEIAEAGDTVIIGGGEYRELLKPKNDGTATRPITFKAKEGEEVLFTAFQEINEFAQYKDGILVASVPWDLGLGRNQVFYKGKNLIEARYPNPVIKENGLVTYKDGIDLDPVWITVGDIKVKNKNILEAYSDTLLQEDQKDYWKGAVLVSQQGAAWTLSSAIVKGSSKGKLELGDISSKWWFGDEGNAPNYGYLTCHINCIDVPGEWTIKNNLLYILPPEGETKDTLEVLVKKRQLLFDLNDRKYIHIEGIKGFGGGARMNNSEMCVINNCDMSYISHYSYFQDNRNLYIDDGNTLNPNGAPQRGEVGIFIGGENNAIVNSKISYSAGAGVFFVGSYGYVTNNIIHDCAYGGTSCGAIHFDAEQFGPQNQKRGGHTFLRNTVYNVARNAISIQRPEGLGWGPTSFLPTEIAYNDVFNSSICTLDTGMIYTWGSNVEHDIARTSIHNNYVYGISEKAVDILGAIYFDNWMNGVDCYDNVIFANRAKQFNNDIYEQRKRQFKTSYATVDSWNNINLDIKIDGKNDLKVNDFPSAKPFKAGADFADFDYNLTYESYTNNNEGIYSMDKMVTSEGVEVTSSGLKFTGEGQMITLKDIDYEKGNMLNIVYRADYYKDADVYNVIVGDINKPIGQEKITLYPESKNPADNNTAFVNLKNYDVNEDTEIHIVPEIYGNAKIFGANISKRASKYDGYVQDYKRVMCGVFDKYYWSPLAEGKPTAISRPAVDADFPVLQAAWGGNWVSYSNVEVKKDVNKFNISIGTGGPWAGLVANLRVGSPDAPIIATVTTRDTDWALKEMTAELTETLKAGTYDLYLTFEGEGKCADIYWLGLE